MSFDPLARRDPVETNPWQGLRKFTDARIALGRTGESLPTDAVLDFGLAHAQARDAVHVPMDADAIATQLGDAGFPTLRAHSAAKERREYLVRPDYGRRLDDASREALLAARPAGPIDAVIVVADGLSAFAPSRHAVPFLKVLHERLAGWRLAPVVVALQSRVALGDEIGEIFDAEMVVMLIGERPGLSSPDSLGIYLTYRPRVGRSDAERNCISNVRPGGLDFETAAFKLHYLMENARRRQLTGVDLKDNSDDLLLGGVIPKAIPLAE
ncbi:MAG TPA: ethanolamine ammonia-lyase subunit EutC [Chthoniobacterales bacterium]|jgi:ethanolamine ammonia-lyase small subunit